MIKDESNKGLKKQRNMR